MAEHSERTIYRNQTGTWMYRLLPIAAVLIPVLMGGGQVPIPVAITAAVLSLAALIYAKVKLHGRVDEVRIASDPPRTLRLRQPGMIGSKWRTLKCQAATNAKLTSTNVRNAASAYSLIITVPGKPDLRLPMNGAAIDLDEMAAFAPEAIVEFREASQHARIHYDL
ncbi:MAG: hypothetical protein AAFR75_04240 [Pseudomonadota bacterium]